MPVCVLSLVSLHEWMQSKPARTASNKAPELTRAKAQRPPLCPRTLQIPWLLSCCRLFPMGVEGNVQKVQVAGVLTRSGLLPR